MRLSFYLPFGKGVAKLFKKLQRRFWDGNIAILIYTFERVINISLGITVVPSPGHDVKNATLVSDKASALLTLFTLGILLSVYVRCRLRCFLFLQRGNKLPVATKTRRKLRRNISIFLNHLFFISNNVPEKYFVLLYSLSFFQLRIVLESWFKTKMSVKLNWNVVPVMEKKSRYWQIDQKDNNIKFLIFKIIA